MSAPDNLITVTPTAAAEFDVNPRTIKRWIADRKLGFPQPIRVNRRLYLRRSEVDAWKARAFGAGLGASA